MENNVDGLWQAELPMVGSWNWAKAKIADGGNSVELLLVEALDGIMDEYVRDEDNLIGPDVRDDLSHDILVYRKRLIDIVMARNAER